MGADDDIANRGPGIRGDEDVVAAGALDCGHLLREGDVRQRGREADQGHLCPGGNLLAGQGLNHQVDLALSLRHVESLLLQAGVARGNLLPHAQWLRHLR